MLSTFLAVLRRDLLLAWRGRADVLVTLAFFIIVVCLFPFGVGAEPNLLRAIAPGVLWVAALLACLLSLHRLFAQDYADGTLEQLLLSGLPRGDTGTRMSVACARLRREAPERADACARQRGLAPEALQRQLRGDLDSIVALATAQDPDERYPSARALADDLKLWLRGRPVQARGNERGYRLRRAARRWWPALAAAPPLPR